MAYLIDTNIILRMAEPDHPMSASALNALEALRQREEERYLTHQNLVEFWSSFKHLRLTSQFAKIQVQPL